MHLIRNAVGLDDLYGSETGWAQEVLAVIDDLFLAWHLYKQGWFDQVALQQALISVRQALRDLLMPTPFLMASCGLVIFTGWSWIQISPSSG